MTEPQRIRSLFEDLYNGDPWLDITLLGTLEIVSAEQAAKKPANGGNSIWEITNHLISWRKAVLDRVNGKNSPSPEHNYFLPVNDTSETAWANTLRQLETTQNNWIKFLAKMQETNLSNIYPGNGQNHYYHIHGLLQHDAYHLGQIVMLAKHA